MGMGDKLNKAVVAWGVLAMVIVIMSIILLKFRLNDSVACASSHPVFNASQTICCLNSTGTGCAVNTTTQALYSDVGTFVTAFSEPRNWVVIVLIATIGIGLIAYFRKQKGSI